MAGSLEDKEGLVKWKCRHVLRGALMRQFDPKLIDADTDVLNAACEEAADLSGAKVAADHGTLLHALCEDYDRTGAIDPRHKADIDAYARATQHLTMLEVEQFGVLDDIRVAGTWDRVVQLPDGRRVVADIKTGDITRPQKIGMQLALYARAQPYDHPGKRHPHRALEQDRGIVIHLPAGKATCDLYTVDMVRGWDDVRLALKVREARRGVPRMVPLEVSGVEDLDVVHDAIAGARSLEELTQVWARYVNTGWNDTHTAAAVVRKQQLTGEAS